MDHPNQKTSVMAIIGLILGIIGLLLSGVPIINNFAFVLAVLGLACGIIGLVGVKKGKRKGGKMAVVAIVLSVLAFAIVLASQAFYGKVLDDASKSVDETAGKMSGEKTDDLLKTDVDVKLGKFEATQDEYGIDKTVLPVKVTNKNAEAKSYSIQVEAVDAKGNRIADDYVHANDLGAGQTQDFKVFEFVASDKVEALKAATFKIVKVSQT